MLTLRGNARMCWDRRIDGRVIDRHHGGETIAPQLGTHANGDESAERAVLKLLRD